MQSTILVRLNGGLGNQMFQYAAGRALADRLDAELLLDTRALEHALARHPYTRRPYALAGFDIRARCAQSAELAHWPNWQAEIGLRLRPLRAWLRHWYFESGISFHPELLELRAPVCLVGYWQSERYFADIAQRLAADFRLHDALAGENAAWLARARGAHSVGVHVRRGDMVTLADAARVHGLCSPGYYERARDRLRAHDERCDFLVFSDDPEWARAELPLPAGSGFVRGNEAHPERDLALMSACRHHIIANSSFSWWAAWLGYHPDQVVVAPAPWYADPRFGACELALARWATVSRV